MTDLKERRQRAIADLIRSDCPRESGRACGALAALGFAVTQATISRDLDQIGAVKVRRDGQLSYALPDPVRGAAKPAPRGRIPRLGAVG